MINLELNSKVRISIPLLAIAGAYVAVRILKERGTKLPALDELTSKIKSFVGSTSSSMVSQGLVTSMLLSLWHWWIVGSSLSVLVLVVVAPLLSLVIRIILHGARRCTLYVVILVKIRIQCSDLYESFVQGNNKYILPYYN